MAGVKLGTVLVREGVITPQQLEEALRIQVLYGGRLGTNLVDLRYIDLEKMAEWLGRATGFPVATDEMCQEAPAEAVALIGSEMAERFECFPLRKDGRRLHLAMVNPADLAATDALSFKTGLRIVPYVVPELRLYGWLEKRYGVERKLRYIRLSAKEDPTRQPQTTAPSSASPVRPGGVTAVSVPSTSSSPTLPPVAASAPPSNPSGYNPFGAGARQPTPQTAPRMPVDASRAAAPATLTPVTSPTVQRPGSEPTAGAASNGASPFPTLPPLPSAAPVAATRPDVRPVTLPPAPKAPTFSVAPAAIPPSYFSAQPSMPPVARASTPPGVAQATVRPTVPPPPVPGLRPPSTPQAGTAPSVPRVQLPGSGASTPPPVSHGGSPRVNAGLPPGGVASSPPPAAGLSLTEAIVALESAPGRDEVADTILRYGTGLLDTAMMFLVRDGMALGWKGRGARFDPSVVEMLMLPLNAPSMFQAAMDTKTAYAGPVTDLTLHRHFYKALRRDPPQSVVVVPVVMRDRVVNVIYGDRLERHDAAVASAGLVELASHVAGAYERILRDSKKRLA